MGRECESCVRSFARVFRAIDAFKDALEAPELRVAGRAKTLEEYLLAEVKPTEEEMREIKVWFSTLQGDVESMIRDCQLPDDEAKVLREDIGKIEDALREGDVTRASIYATHIEDELRFVLPKYVAEKCQMD